LLPEGFATGCQLYRDELPGTNERLARVVVTVLLEDLDFNALLDTGANDCVLAWQVAEQVPQLLEPAEIQVRALGGNVHVGLYFPVVLVFPADEGQDLTLDTFAWASETFSGPSLIGYGGMLEKIRFALDPEHNLFYFGA
jgi:predicted aspartyl protease